MKNHESIDLLIKNSLKSLDNIQPDDELKMRTLDKISKTTICKQSKKNHCFNYRKISSIAAMFVFVCFTFSVICPRHPVPQEACKNDDVSNSGNVENKNDKNYMFDTKNQSIFVENFIDFFNNEKSKESKNQSVITNSTIYRYSNSINSNIISYDGNIADDIMDSVVVGGSMYIGEWNDNKNWASACSLMSLANYGVADNAANSSNTASVLPVKGIFGITLTSRIKVSVTDNGVPVNSASVVGYNNENAAVYHAISDNNGRAYLFNKVFSTSDYEKIKYIIVTKNDMSITVDVNTDVINVELQNANTVMNEKILELMFVINTKSTMKDELQTLTDSIDDIVDSVKMQNPNIKIRISVNFYRDFGELYLYRPFQFIENTDTAINILKNQDCTGSGDYEEALDYALINAVNEHSWSNEAYSKLLFIMCDYPPKQNHDTDVRF